MAQFFHSKAVVSSILFVGKSWNFMRKGSIKDLTLLVKYINTLFRYHNKDIKMLVAFLPTLKMVLSNEIKSNITGAAARNCSLKKGIVKDFEKFVRNYLCWSFLLKKMNEREKKPLVQLLFCEFCEFFSEPFFWRLLMGSCFWGHYPEWPIKIL